MDRRTPLRPMGSGGMGPSSSLDRLDVADGYAFGDPPRIGPHGARNAARPTVFNRLLDFEVAATIERLEFLVEVSGTPGLRGSG